MLLQCQQEALILLLSLDSRLLETIGELLGFKSGALKAWDYERKYRWMPVGCGSLCDAITLCWRFKCRRFDCLSKEHECMCERNVCERDCRSTCRTLVF